MVRVLPDRLLMYTLTVELEFCYGHRLLSYEGKCRFPHGHNGRVQIQLVGDKVDACGMVMDFTAVKRGVSRWIDETLDHRMILHESDPLAKYLQEQGEPVHPIADHPTTETIARLIYEFCKAQGYPVTQVTLWETSKNCAAYSE